MLPSSRREARERGLPHYEGKPCQHGHGTKRFTANTKCVVCAKKEGAAYHAANRSRIAEAHQKWLAKNGDKRRLQMSVRYRKKKKEIREKEKVRYQKNRERILRRAAKYRAEHQQEIRQAARSRYLENKAIYALYSKVRKMRARTAAGSFKPRDLLKILQHQKNRCAYCRVSLRGIEKHIDHIIPIFGGGTNHPRNLQYLCKPCNLKKGAKDPLVFARSIGRLL